jgi:hypothetical protein
MDLLSSSNLHSETAPNPESTEIVNITTTTAADDDGAKVNSQNSSKKRRLKEESKVKIKKRKVQQDSGDLSLKGDPSDSCETDNAMVKKKQLECKLLTSETQSLTISVDSGLGAVSDMVLFPSLTHFFFLFCLPISPVLSSLQIIIF